MSPDWIGWVSTAVLIATVGRQAFTQWKSESTEGVSHWLYIGQLVTSFGYVVYSLLLGNWIFVVSNLFLLVIAAVGQVLLLRNRSRSSGAKPPVGLEPEAHSSSGR